MSHEDQIKNAVYDILPDIESVSTVKKDEKYIVEATYNLTDGFGLKNFAEQVARDYTFAVYATGLPIAQSYIVINKPDGTPGLIVIVGNNQAETQPESTWSSKDIASSVFIDWVKKNTSKDYNNSENHTLVNDNF